MDLINDLGTDLALAFLVEQRYRQKIEPARARALIEKVRILLESSSHVDPPSQLDVDYERARSFSAH